MLLILQQLKDAMQVVLNNMMEGDRFAVMEFSGRASFWKRQLVPVTPSNIQEGISYVKERRATGGIGLKDLHKYYGISVFSVSLSLPLSHFFPRDAGLWKSILIFFLL